MLNALGFGCVMTYPVKSVEQCVHKAWVYLGLFMDGNRLLGCSLLKPLVCQLCSMDAKHDLIIHEMIRKKGKATQHNRKTKQHNATLTQGSCFSKKK